MFANVVLIPQKGFVKFCRKRTGINWSSFPTTKKTKMLHSTKNKKTKVLQV